MKQTSQINIKISQRDKEKIEKKAKAAGLSTGAYMKLMALKGDIAVIRTEK